MGEPTGPPIESQYYRFLIVRSLALMISRLGVDGPDIALVLLPGDDIINRLKRCAH